MHKFICVLKIGVHDQKKFGDHCSKQPDMQETVSTGYLC